MPSDQLLRQKLTPPCCSPRCFHKSRALVRTSPYLEPSCQEGLAYVDQEAAAAMRLGQDPHRLHQGVLAKGSEGRLNKPDRPSPWGSKLSRGGPVRITLGPKVIRYYSRARSPHYCAHLSLHGFITQSQTMESLICQPYEASAKPYSL